ncbi:unnamed protein product [Coffea canephora]|uniref:DH200=94 genomic scaffold, scaffold_300 n=1 Tax=Coffea canephora TaxID=49390 RepID=A0A068VEB0_COFCA|nr:unnamed protein product [Coffea canephora]
MFLTLVLLLFYNRELKKDAVVDESWFSDPPFCEEQKVCIHAVSPTVLVEVHWSNISYDQPIINYDGCLKWPLILDLNIFISAICLSPVTETIGAPNAGAESFPDGTHRWVDVRDVAYAHILAFEVPSASGRYCLVGRSAHASQVIKILHELYPSHQFPNEQVLFSLSILSV